MAIVISNSTPGTVSMLEIIQDVCLELGINVPNAVITSSDAQVLQLLALLNKEGRYLAARPAQGWESMQAQATFTTVATENQGSVESFAPGYRFIVNNTIWNRTKRIPLFGSLSAQEWQTRQGWYYSSPYSQYRVMNGNINFFPVPTAGDSCYFEYVTKLWVTDGTQSYSSYQNDADYTYLDDELLRLGLLWRWKKAKGLEYSQEFAEYEERVMNAIGRNTPKPNLNMANTNNDIQPFVIVPSGNWSA